MKHPFLRAFSLLVAAAAAVALAGCDTATGPEPEPLVVTIESPAPGLRLYSTSADVTGRVVDALAPVVTYSVNGSAFAAATVASDGHFRIDLSTAAPGSVSLVVRARDGARVGEVTRDFELVTLDLSLDNPSAGATVYGRVVSFAGNNSEFLTVRTSLNGGAERLVQLYPPMPGNGSSPFRARVHPLVNGTNKVVISYYDGERLVARDSFQVTAEVPERQYSAVEIDIPGSTEFHSALLGNDGRIAGNFRDASSVQPNTLQAYTWKSGILTELTGMGQVNDLNNIGQVLGFLPGSLNATVIWNDGAYAEVPNFERAIRMNDHGHLARAGDPGYWNGEQFVSYHGNTGEYYVPGGINNFGQIVGAAITGSPYQSARLWLAPPSVTGSPASHRETRAMQVSDGGHVVLIGSDPPPMSATPEFTGTLTYVIGGGVHLLNDLVGFRPIATDVNATGTVAGTYDVGGEVRGFTWVDGRTTDVAIGGAYALNSISSINDSGNLAAIATRKADGRKVVLLLTPQ